MGLNDTVSAERIHISFFGRRNAGKSSLVNAVTGQELSVVSEIKGTTTDPVKKAMELLPLGPVLITDTPGIDDEGLLGEKRTGKSKNEIRKTDIAVIVADGCEGSGEWEKELTGIFSRRNVPFVIAYTKADLMAEVPQNTENEIYTSSVTGYGIEELKNRLSAFADEVKNSKLIVADLIMPGDTVVLVIPIDGSSPKGRIILPQQLTLRELLDYHCTAVCCRPEELKQTLSSLKEPPALVITDSQVFEQVGKIVSRSTRLTSFSILFARYKGELGELVKGARALSGLKSGDTVLISEGCTHHRQCNDIGTVKLPGWIEKYTGVKPGYLFTSGGEFPDNLSGISLIVHCGGCMLNEKEMHSRIEKAKEKGVPIVNYGIAIAQMHGILDRSLEVFES
ncbi:MAG: [FeFe] hydrogenase H-cluster maturation GTPase HydF [Clostridia bacterium]|nr:[FeFe] hydrogenase H-cluster maturation GTPase HydF [Clostridia bacterium]